MLAEVLLGAVFLLLLWFYVLRKPEGLPPGRWGLPLVGYIPLTKKTIDGHLQDFQKEYGDIYVWRMGTQVMVFLHSFQLCREALSGSEFVDRPHWELFRFLEPVTLGVIGSNGQIWHSNRRFSLRQLRDQGMGKSSLVSAVQHQASKLVDALKRQDGKAAPVPDELKVAIINVIWFMVASKQFEMSDPKLQEFLRIMDSFMKNLEPLAIPDFMPWIKYCVPQTFQRRWFSLDILIDLKDSFFVYCEDLMKEHRSSMDPNHPRDLMDAYLSELEKGDDEQHAHRCEKDLFSLILDLFFAGSETTTSTLTFMFYYLANHPEVQRKFQAEIDEVLPKGTLATLDDRRRMPYTEAVLHEVLRRSTLAATGVQHVAMRDTTLGGYRIPKGTIINTAASVMHHDPRYWNQPEKFNPERWLNDEGKFTPQKEGFLPFGIGKRVCVGESLARMELFIISTAVFQSLSVSPPPGGVVDDSPDPVNPFTHSPRQQNVVFTLR